MKKRKFSVRRHTRATADAQRRRDQAYQHLIRWSVACLSEVPQGHIRQENSEGSVAIYVRVSTQLQAQTQTHSAAMRPCAGS